jgi:hypothetical protein
MRKYFVKSLFIPWFLLYIFSKPLLTGDHKTGATQRRSEPQSHASFRKLDRPEPPVSHRLYHLKADHTNSGYHWRLLILPSEEVSVSLPKGKVYFS